MKRILFLCNGNSARSQMAEALLRHIGSEYFEAFSAGTDPDACVHPLAIETLQRNHVRVEGLVTKDVAMFAEQRFDFVISLCDRSHERPSVLQGADMIYWRFPDPTQHADEAVKVRAFEDVFRGLERRIRLLIAVSTGRGKLGRPLATAPQPSW
jgi:protein-tyrosine-phosphatase